MSFRSYTVLATPQANSNSSCLQKTHNSTTPTCPSSSTATLRATQSDRCATQPVPVPVPGRDATADSVSSVLSSLAAARRPQAARPGPGRRPGSRVPVIQPAGARTSCRPSAAEADVQQRRAAAAGVSMMLRFNVNWQKVTPLVTSLVYSLGKFPRVNSRGSVRVRTSPSVLYVVRSTG